MRILLDHCVDWRLARSLPSHAVRNAQEMGWDRLKNGELLRAAQREQFDLLLTVDRKLKHEQNLASLPVAVVIFLVVRNRLPDLIALVPAFDAQ